MKRDAEEKRICRRAFTLIRSQRRTKNEAESNVWRAMYYSTMRLV